MVCITHGIAHGSQELRGGQGTSLLSSLRLGVAGEPDSGGLTVGVTLAEALVAAGRLPPAWR